MEEKGRNRKPEFFRQKASRGDVCTDSPSPSPSAAELIFVTNITNYICGEKIVMWRNFSFPCMTIVGELKISPHVEPKSTFVKKK